MGLIVANEERVSGIELPRHPAARRPRVAVAAVALGAFALEMAVSGRYGYHRDELYFLECGRHLALGYVDQPALTPLVVRFSSAVFSNSLVGLRVVPALCAGAVVVATASLSAMLGAGRAGQVIAAVAAATCGEYLAAFHLLTTTTLDFTFWALTLVLVTKLVVTGDRRYLLALGACVGIAADAKWNIAWLVLALVAGLLLTPQRRLLSGRYLLAGAVIAFVLASPDVIWQSMHGWPNVAVFRVLQASAGHNRAVYWPGQVLYSGGVLTPVWVAGLWWSLRSPDAARFRFLGIASVLVLVGLFLLGGKPYYAGGIFVFLFAAGSVAVERYWHARATAAPGDSAAPAAPAARARRQKVIVAATILSVAVALPIALPVLPARTLHTVALQKINYDLAETIAWPKLVAKVAAEFDTLSPAERAVTAIVTGNYGEAGAIDRYGAAFGLPQAFSGDNNFWLWGPPPAHDRYVVAVNLDPKLLHAEFGHVVLGSTFSNGLGVADDEQGVQILLASGPRGTWQAIWPAFRYYG